MSYNLKDESFISGEEKFVYWYLMEAREAGYINEIVHQPKASTIIPEVVYSIKKQLKTKSKTIEKTLIQPLTYQPDFAIYWNKSARGIFIPMDNEDYKGYPFYANYKDKIFYSIIDVKGNYSQNDSHRRFSIEQKIIYYIKNVYVQRIIPVPVISKSGKIKFADAIFYCSFLPRKYTLTDKTKKPRKINFKYKTLEEYVKYKKDNMETIPNRLQASNIQRLF